jgi:hypothetical protein
MVLGLLAYIALLPAIMFTAMPVNAVPTWAQRAVIVPIGVVVFLVGRWAWKSAKRARPAEVPLVGAGTE